MTELLAEVDRGDVSVATILKNNYEKNMFKKPLSKMNQCQANLDKS